MVTLCGLFVGHNGLPRLEARLEGFIGGLAVLGAAVAVGGGDKLLIEHLGLEHGAVNERAHTQGLGLLALLVEVGLVVGRGLEQLFGAAVVERLNAVVEDAVGDDVGLDSHCGVVLGVGLLWKLKGVVVTSFLW